MPNIKSAKKRVKTGAKKNENNTVFKSSMKTAVKNVEKAVKANDVTTAQDALKTAHKRIDKACTSGIIKANKAARDKSRLTKMVNELK